MAIMSVPSLAKLSREFERSTHSARVRRMALLGRDERGTAALAKLLDELGRGTGYEQYLALVAAEVAEDRLRVFAATQSPLHRVRSFAFGAAFRLGVAPDVLWDAADRAGASDRAYVARLVAKAPSADLADRLIDEVRRRRGDSAAASMLRGCQPQTVARLLPQLDHAVRSWRALAKRHDQPVLDHVETVIRAAPPSRRDQLWRRYEPAIAVVLRVHERRVLSLLDEIGPSSGAASVVRGQLGWLTRRNPSWVGRALLAPEYRPVLSRSGLPSGLRRTARLLGTADREALARVLRDRPANLARFLRSFPPAERAAIFRGAYADVDRAQLVVSGDVMRALPIDVRTTEAQRMLQLRVARENPAVEATFTAYLPIALARPALEARTSAALAEDRAVAHGLLVSCAAVSRSPEGLAAALSYVTQRVRNEQDPVRLAVANAIAAVPPTLIGSSHLDPLASFVTSVVEARRLFASDASGTVGFRSTPADRPLRVDGRAGRHLCSRRPRPAGRTVGNHQLRAARDAASGRGAPRFWTRCCPAFCVPPTSIDSNSPWPSLARSASEPGRSKTSSSCCSAPLGRS